jgi:cytochrome c peroxidase
MPRHRKDGLKGFFWPRQQYQDDVAHRPGARNASCCHCQASISPLAQLGWNVPRGRSTSKQDGSGFPFLMVPQQQGSTALMVQ